MNKYQSINIRVFLFIFTMLTIGSINLSAQSSEKEIGLSKKANTKYSFSDYNAALPLYKGLLEIDSMNFQYNYRVGVCYLKSNLENSKSVFYFERALKCKPTTDALTFDFYYYMGSAYKITNDFDKALECFQLAKTLNGSVDSIVKKEIAQCEGGIKMVKQPTDARIFNLGKSVNSIYPDYSSLLLHDKSAIVFASTRSGSTGNKKSIDGGDYYEDVYIAKNVSKTAAGVPEFSKASNLAVPTNTSANDAALTLSADGSTLYLYRKNKLCESQIVAGKLTPPKKYINTAINKADKSPSMYFTSNDQVLYFVSARPGGFGGKDIYGATRQGDGTWGAAVNLGPTVNTSADEESPYFDSSDNTLYFSSQGHNSIGGFDVFKTKSEGDNKWAKPENLGYPINSGSDDVFFQYNKNDNLGYYTTMRKDGIGNYDIYMVRYLQPLRVLIDAHYEQSLEPKDLKVVVLNDHDTTHVSVNPKKEIAYENNSNYKLLIPRYNDDNVLDTLYFKTPESVERDQYLQEINFIPVKNKKGGIIGYKTVVYNAFFNIEEAIVTSGVRNNQVLLLRFPMCNKVDPIYSYYSNPNLTREEEHSKFIKTLKPDFKNFKMYSQTNYLDSAEVAALNAPAVSMDSVAAAPTKKEAKEEKSKIEEKKKEVVAAKDVAKVAKEEKAKEVEKVVEEEAELLFDAIYFDFAQLEIEAKFQKTLDSVANYMENHSSARLEIHGYSDSVGTEHYNNVLSEYRAYIIKRELMKKGVRSSRMTPVGKGEDVREAGKEGVPADFNPRRVEFIIVGKKR